MRAVAKEWIDELGEELREMRVWLLNPANVDACLEELADLMVDKHFAGEATLPDFGEMGILVRAADQVAQLHGLLDRVVKDDNRADAWQDLAGHALQALILLKRGKMAEQPDLYETRRKRLIRGFCPDCGNGVLLRRQQWERLSVHLFCSETCGFSAEVDLFDLEETGGVIHTLAERKAVEAQR